MIQELVYTSVPKGLLPDSQGFCTVQCTHGMAPNLLRELEKLSGYRHPFLPGSVQYALNPVSFMHVVRRVGGSDFHIVARVADCGLDYTQRTNKIAHIFAIDQRSLPQCGPADIASASGLFLNSWSGKPSEVAERTSLATSSSQPQKCVAWEQHFGDAGWGGVMAQAVENGNPVSLIFEPGQSVLPLIVESLAFLPQAKRWSVTFSTFFMKSQEPSREKIQIKGILLGSEEMAYSRLSQQTLIADLSKRTVTGKLEGKYVEWARTGHAPQAAEPTPELTKPQRGKDKPDSKDVSHATSDGIYDLNDVNVPARQRTRPPLYHYQGKKKKLSPIVMLVVGLGVTLLLLLGLGLAVIFNDGVFSAITGEKTAAQRAAAKAETERQEKEAADKLAAEEAKKKQEKLDAAAKAEAEKQRQAAADKEKNNKDAEEAEKARIAEAERLAAETAEADRKKKEENAKQKLADLITGLSPIWGVPAIEPGKNVPLANSEQLFQFKDRITLELLPWVALDSGRNSNQAGEKITPIKSAYDKESQTIKFYAEERRTDVAGATTTGEVPIATISLTDEGLVFQWDDKLPTSSLTMSDVQRLHYPRILLSKLRVSSGDGGASKDVVLLSPAEYRVNSIGSPVLCGEPFELWSRSGPQYIFTPQEVAIHFVMPTEPVENLQFSHEGADYRFVFTSDKGEKHKGRLTIKPAADLKLGVDFELDSEKPNKEAKTRLEAKWEEVDKQIKAIPQTINDLQNKLQMAQMQSNRDEVQRLNQQIGGLPAELQRLSQELKSLKDEIKKLGPNERLRNAIQKAFEPVPFSISLLRKGGDAKNEADLILLLEVKP